MSSVSIQIENDDGTQASLSSVKQESKRLLSLLFDSEGHFQTQESLLPSEAHSDIDLEKYFYTSPYAWHRTIIEDLHPSVAIHRPVGLEELLSGVSGAIIMSLKRYFGVCLDSFGDKTLRDRTLRNLIYASVTRSSQPSEKVEAMYGMWMLSSFAICEDARIPLYKFYGVHEEDLYKLLVASQQRIAGLPRKLQLLFQNLGICEYIFERQRLRFVTWLDVNRGDWTLCKVAELPFGIIHNACIAYNVAEHSRSDQVESRSVTKQRYRLEVAATSTIWAFMAMISMIQAHYVLLKTFGNMTRARERFYSALSGVRTWAEGNPYLGPGRWHSTEAEADVNIYRKPPDGVRDCSTVLRAFADQGLVLYADYDSIRKRQFDNTHRLIRLYTPRSTKTHLVGWSARDAITHIGSIHHVADGGRASSSALSLVVVWLYILSSLSVSILTPVLNWGERDNAFERISDGIWVVTALLISVFGLVKLTSEDPNSIRHALSGRRLLSNPRQVYEYLKLPFFCDKANWEQVLKGVVAIYPNALEWLSDHETGFAPVQPAGDMRLGGGLRVQSAIGFGLLPTDEGVINTRVNKTLLLKHAENDPTWLQIRREDPPRELHSEDVLTTISDKKYV